MKIANDITELIGGTPLVRLGAAARGARAEVAAKLEYFNPGSSAKDRAALGMIAQAEADGKLRPGAVIVEPTSGNTGVSIAMIAAARGYRTILTMPENMSAERRTLLRGLGAKLVLTPSERGMEGAIEAAESILAATPGAVSLRQFDNPANPAAHRSTTAEEIWRDTDGNVDILVAGVGSGGTISGTASKLKQYNPALLAVAVEPAESPVLSGGLRGPHIIQGIGAGFAPSNLDRSLIDIVMPVAGRDALATARELIRSEGILCGISSGAAAFAAITMAKDPAREGQRIVFIVPDTSDRYLSTELFAEPDESGKGE